MGETCSPVGMLSFFGTSLATPSHGTLQQNALLRPTLPTLSLPPPTLPTLSLPPPTLLLLPSLPFPPSRLLSTTASCLCLPGRVCPTPQCTSPWGCMSSLPEYQAGGVSCGTTPTTPTHVPGRGCKLWHYTYNTHTCTRQGV